MRSRASYECRCEDCQSGSESIQPYHQQLIRLLIRLNEQQRRWLAAAEANRFGYGDTEKLQAITELELKTLCVLLFGSS